jgi:hypothetical protein
MTCTTRLTASQILRGLRQQVNHAYHSSHMTVRMSAAAAAAAAAAAVAAMDVQSSE